MTEAPERSTQTEVLLAAAVSVVAEEGFHGLTQPAVDEAAGLPEGTCSTSFETREALVRGLTDYVARRAGQNLGGLAAELGETALVDDKGVDAVTRALLRAVQDRDLLVTRFELNLRAARDPELATVLSGHRRVLVDVLGGMLTGRGKPLSAASAETLVASFDGVMMGALPRPEAQRKAFVRRSVEALMSGLG
jgi:DNA-binding transcriptional regulator YbjK